MNSSLRRTLFVFPRDLLAAAWPALAESVRIVEPGSSRRNPEMDPIIVPPRLARLPAIWSLTKRAIPLAKPPRRMLPAPRIAITLRRGAMTA